MLKVIPVLSLVLLATASVAFAQTQTNDGAFSIPAWIDKGKCTGDPAFGPTLNGKPAKVNKELAPTSDQIILLVLDVTDDISRINDAKQAIVTNISNLPHNVWVGVLRAQDGMHVLVDPTPDRQKVINTIQSFTSSGTPGLLETVRPTLSLADAMIRKSPVRVSVLYITDGSIYSYREDYTDPVINPSDAHDLSRRFRDVLINEKISKLKRHISSLEAPLFVVHLHYRQNDLDLAYQNGLDALAKDTGGETVICRSTAEISQAISHIFSRISDVWGLVLSVPNKADRELQVGLKASCGGQEVQISWRPHFRPKEE
ncbi:MAG: VWA domain-containing protein [Acidobacteria bacterium]|nr:MAG: VWA domain-containing protein [Acidobacteriota bacterium]